MTIDDIQMKDKAREDMNAFGAKIGLNKYLHGCMPDHTLPQVIIKRERSVTKQEIDTLLSFGRQIGATGDLAVRGSVADDLIGLDDAIPTIFTPGNSADANEAASQIFRSMDQPDLRHLAMQECGGYNKESESVAFSNALTAPYIVAAEHPNQLGTVMIDVWNYQANEPPYAACLHNRGRTERNIYSGSLRDGAFLRPNNLEDQNLASLDSLRCIPGLIEEARGHLGVSQNDAFLFEMGVHPSTEAFVILQTKFLGRKQEGTSKNKNIGRRIFGIGELELHLVSTERRTEDILSMHSWEQEFLLNPHNTHEELNRRDYSPWIKGYVPGISGNPVALIHNHLRFVRACLTNGGIAILDYRAAMDLKDLNTDIVKITSTGYEYTITGA